MADSAEIIQARIDLENARKAFILANAAQAQAKADFDTARRALDAAIGIVNVDPISAIDATIADLQTKLSNVQRISPPQPAPVQQL